MTASMSSTAEADRRAQYAAGYADRAAAAATAHADRGAAAAAAAAKAAGQRLALITGLFEKGLVSREEWTAEWQLAAGAAQRPPVAAPAPLAAAAALRASATSILAVAPLVAAQIRGGGVAAAAVHGHREPAVGAEAAASRAVAAGAIAAHAIAPAAAAGTAAAAEFPAAAAHAAVVPFDPSQSSRGRQLKPTERKSNEDVPDTGKFPILLDPYIGLR